ncbi:hypothetical protein SAMN05421788_103337 [Filimonas lacunae]|uniref:Ketoreductase domain-containing protein n=1 Tax=Filimonas lacunae TaxID=477680 RepID=A0A173MK71_9BACT|nr:SDR family NAD(P)-dependent oxidoreductase [Filimonas lacunae]BAV07994.1 short-chain dehydrogenase/reductase SDR [Filimonas lacunae]SIT07642.1 hypothetical protein SAMN05421788_103337 [Filimonas lacunae]
MKRLQLHNQWVLLTGASAGLGQEMARQLAFEHKANLIIVARRAEKLELLKAMLEKEAGVQVRVIAADLSIPADVERVLDQSLAGGQLYGAILNAGLTFFGRHTDLPWDHFNAMLQTNVVSVLRMTSRLVQHFESSGKEGGVMVVSSMAALYPVPYQAAYSATKAFLLSFANALSHELQNKQFSITAYTPAGIATEMTEGEAFHGLKSWLMPVQQAAKEGLQAFITRKHSYIPGVLNRLGSKFMHLLPKRFVAGQMGKIYYKALLQSEAAAKKP